MAISPSSPPGVQRQHPSKRWWRSKAIGGRSRTVLRQRKTSSGSITTRADPGMGGIPTFPWRCAASPCSGLYLSIALGWVHDRFSCRTQRFDPALVGIEGFIRQQGISLHLRQERIGSFQGLGLGGRQEKRNGIAQCVDHGVDFGAQSALAAPDRLVLVVFFWAPALCWCARTMVLSIMAYSLSASAARISNPFFHTPLPAQRENRV